MARQQPPVEPLPEAARAISVGESVYLPGTPEMIAPARATHIYPHPNGRYVLVVQEEAALPPGPDIGQPTTGSAALILWDTVARKSRVLWQAHPRGDADPASVRYVQWLAGSDVCVFLVRTMAPAPEVPEGQRALYVLLSADVSRDVRAQTRQSSFTEPYLLASAVLPRAVLMKREVQPEQGALSYSLQFIEASGRAGKQLTITISDAVAVAPVAWDKTGNLLYLRVQRRDNGPAPPTDAGGKPARPLLFSQWYTLDSRTGEMTLLPGLPEKGKLFLTRPAPPAPPPLVLSTRPIPIPGADGKPSDSTLRSLWLGPAAGPGKVSDALMLAPNVQEERLTPDLRAVLYVSEGAMYAIPLVRLPAGRVGKVGRDAILRRAKQIAVSLMMYAQDYEETFPPATDAASRLTPYLKNDSVFQNPVTNGNGFTYLLDGGDLKAVGDPAKTRLGTLSGPGGRAVLFVDGHVVWEPDNQP